jgi:protease-4
LYAEGGIQDGEGDDSNIASLDYIKHIQDIRKDKDVKALVLRVNSGGGSALASEIIWRELELVKKQGIPIIASMGDVAASGGYYICANADTIVAQPNTVTGSIGVFGVFAELGDFYKSKLGMTFDTVKTTRHSDFPTSPLLSHAFNDEDKAIVQKGVDEIYQSFLKRVSDGRKMPVDKVNEIAQGRVWTGTQAQKNGLVDVLGGVEDAIKLAAKRAGLADGSYQVARFPEQEDKFSKLFKNFGADAKQSAIDAELQKQLGSQYKYYQQLRTLSQLQGIQARMPFEFDIK